MNFFEEALSFLNNITQPLAPPGVTGIQFVCVFLIVYAIIIMVVRRIHLFSNNLYIKQTILIS